MTSSGGQLSKIIGKLKATTKYKALNTINSLTNTEKKILERVISIIENAKIDNANSIIEIIIDAFAEKTF